MTSDKDAFRKIGIFLNEEVELVLDIFINKKNVVLETYLLNSPTIIKDEIIYSLFLIIFDLVKSTIFSPSFTRQEEKSFAGICMTSKTDSFK